MSIRARLLVASLVVSSGFEVVVRALLPIWIGVDGFGYWPPIDNFMHFFWGLSIFFIAVTLMRWEAKDGLLTVAVWQLIWEAIEMYGDLLLGQPTHMLDHFFFDGIKDTVLDLLGAAFGWFMLLKIKEGTKDLKPSPYRSYAKILIALNIPLLLVGGIIYFSRLGLEARSPDLFSAIWITITFPIAWIIWKVTNRKAN